MSGRSQAGWIVSGTVEASVQKVWKALLDVHPDLPASVKGTIAAANGTQPLVTSVGKPGEGKVHIEIDTTHHQVIVEGEWWYRGVYSVEPYARGSLLVYRVYNIAPGIGWWAAQLVQGPQHARDMARQFASLLQLIGHRLGCKVDMLAG